MASKRLIRDYPYLSAYLDAPHPNPLVERLASLSNFGCLAAMGGAPMVAILSFMISDRFIGPIGGSLFALGMAVTSGVLLFSFGKRHSEKAAKEATVEDKLMSQAAQAIDHFKKLDRERKLHKWMDPVAIQLLEAGAYHWSRIRQTFDDSRWNVSQLPEHWVGLKQKAHSAANLAMAELVILCAGCTGEPTKTRKDDFQSVFEDLVDLDIEDALRGLAKVTATHPKEYRFQSPQTKEIFEPARQIAERLKQLADEMEQATQIAKTELPQSQLNLGQETIGHLLEEIKAVRQAEQELHQSQRSD